MYSPVLPCHRVQHRVSWTSDAPLYILANSFQEALIRSVYGNNGIDPADTGYVEAHGTISLLEKQAVAY
jgi:acyl transferase domain-containing protein